MMSITEFHTDKLWLPVKTLTLPDLFSGNSLKELSFFFLKESWKYALRVSGQEQ